MKNIGTTRQTIQLTPELPACDIFLPGDYGIQRERGDIASVLVVPGLGSIREDYARFGEVLAAQGLTVYSLNCNDGVQGSQATALTRRADVVQKTLEKLQAPVHIAPHSLGAPVTAIALDAGTENGPNHLVDYVESLHFMQPAGFENHGPDDFLHAWRFFTGEAVNRTVRLMPVVLRGGKASRERFHVRRRADEVKGLWNLGENFMVGAVRSLFDVDKPMTFYVGPRDDLTRAKHIRAATVPIVGDESVIDIHPAAGHLSVVSHPEHMAKHVLARLGLEYFDGLQAA